MQSNLNQDSSSISATYSPDDNKLRLYSVSRLSKEDYAKVKAAGFSWAPKQELFFAVWSPGREDLAIAMAGEIDDEDRSLVDRAEERAERFEDYRDKRARDAQAAYDRSNAIADGIPLGQPILVGHHSEKRARKDVERIQSAMRQAVRMWDTSSYWQDRAKGALAHAKYKELPGVRARRIKSIEADRRKQAKASDQASKFIQAWSKESPISRERAIAIAGQDFLYGRFPIADYPRPEGASSYEGDMSFYSALNDGILSPEEAQSRAIRAHERGNAHRERWIRHYDNRLAYERAMLEESGGLASDRHNLEVGGRVRYRDQWLVISRINRKDGQIVSVSVISRYARVLGVEKIQDYKAPESGDAEKVKSALKLPPMCNYPGEGFEHMTKAEWDKVCSDYRGSSVIPEQDGKAAHRVRSRYGSLRGASKVFLSDQKIIEPKAAALPIEEPEPVDLRPIPAPREPRPAPAPQPETSKVDELRDRLRQGFKVEAIAADQLFPTPPPIVEKMIELAGIVPGMKVLEPSAGTGNLIQPALELGAEVTAVEINAQLASRLRDRFGNVHCADFLELNGELGQFDRVLMNPPFQNAADIKHIKHAIDKLKPGGRLVAICANGPRQKTQLEPLADYWEPLPADSFKSAGTSVNTVLLVIEKEPQ